MEFNKLKWGQLGEASGLKNVIRKFNPNEEGRYELREDPFKGYITGSIYAGQWSPVDMEGTGTYILPHGVVYEGSMKDGMFHGKGTLIYPMGKMIAGEWYEGEITSWNFKYKDTEQCRLDKYCKQPDRRFITSLNNELKPAGKEYLTNHQPTRKIPPDCYDVVDGFYNPKTLWVHSNNDFSRILYMPASGETTDNKNVFKDNGTQFVSKIPFVPIYRSSKWIEENCRKAWDETTGYKPELFEYWFTGKALDREKLDMKLKSEGGNFIWKESMCDEVLKNFEQISEKNQRHKKEQLNLEKKKYSRQKTQPEGETDTAAMSTLISQPLNVGEENGSVDPFHHQGKPTVAAESELKSSGVTPSDPLENEKFLLLF